MGIFKWLINGPIRSVQDSTTSYDYVSKNNGTIVILPLILITVVIWFTLIICNIIRYRYIENYY